jgi:hypothetical protein
MKRTGFARKVYTPTPAAPVRPLVQPVNYARISANDAAVVPKPAAYRDLALLDMARGRPCLMPRPTHAGTDTTVAAHSNHLDHGKARGRKADDCYSVWACALCHGWYDQGCADRYEKRRAFDAALARQRVEWERIATDPGEPLRFRQAARRAVDHINQRRET